MAFKRHNTQWVGVYREDTRGYVGGSSIRVGGSQGYNSYLGFNSSAILNDIATSKVKARVHLRFNVTDPGTFDMGIHREASNKASSGLPYYAWTGRSFFPNNGLASYDITDLPARPNNHMTLEAALRYGGFHGLVLYGARDAGNYGVASSAYIEVEGVWNNPPVSGNVLYPVGGETLNGNVVLRASPGTDPDGDSLQYQFALRDADGYHHFKLQNSLEYPINLANFKETSTAQVAVRAWDGQSYGKWSYSKIFTIRHNIAPSRPEMVEPVGGQAKDRTETISFRWRHVDNDPQSAYRFRWRMKGTTAWNETRVVTTNNYRAVAGNVFPFGEIEWQVLTEDQGGLLSPWSSPAIFLSTEKTNAPTILSPANGGVITSEDLAISWSSGAQSDYEVEVLNGGNVYWHTQRSSGNKGVSVDKPLLNNSTYTVRVRTRAKDGLWSDWHSITVSTSFTPPPMPQLEISTDPETAAIIVDITNPLPQPEEPDTFENSLYRRRPGGEWMRISRSISPGGRFIDYRVASGVVYEYYATAHADNGTSMDSVPVIGQIDFLGVILSHSEVPSLFVPLRYNGSTSFDYQMDVTRKKYSGRTKSVTIFGELDEWSIGTSFLVERENYDKLFEMVSRKETLLFRDSKGRKHFVTPSGFSVKDSAIHGMFEITLPLDEVDFREVV